MGRRGLVVAGFDGSDPSWIAVDHAATEAVLRGHDIRLVRMCDDGACIRARTIGDQSAPIAFANASPERGDRVED